MVTRVLPRLKTPTFSSILIRDLIGVPISKPSSSVFVIPKIPALDDFFDPQKSSYGFRYFRDGRPKGTLWRANTLIGKEALNVISGMKRYKDDEEKLDNFIKTHVLRLVKADKGAVLRQLLHQNLDALSLKMFRVIQEEDWYKPDAYLYKDLIVLSINNGKMDQAMQIWECMKKDELFPDYHTYAIFIKALLRNGSHADAMKIYGDMKKSPIPPEQLPYKVLLNGLGSHPDLRKRVEQDYEEFFPDHNVFDHPEEIFGTRF